MTYYFEDVIEFMYNGFIEVAGSLTRQMWLVIDAVVHDDTAVAAAVAPDRVVARRRLVLHKLSRLHQYMIIDRN